MKEGSIVSILSTCQCQISFMFCLHLYDARLWSRPQDARLCPCRYLPLTLKRWIFSRKQGLVIWPSHEHWGQRKDSKFGKMILWGKTNLILTYKWVRAWFGIAGLIGFFFFWIIDLFPPKCTLHKTLSAVIQPQYWCPIRLS